MCTIDRQGWFVLLLRACMVGVVFSVPAVLLILLAVSSAAAGAGEMEPGHGLQLRGADGAPLGFAPRLRTEITIDVSGIVARARVNQSFRNPGSGWVEGVYVFPLPDDAAVDRLQMRYDRRLIVGEIRERDRARRAYATARAAGQGASLLEQQRANVFTVAVANIPPGDTVEIELEFQHVVQWRDGRFSLRIPTVVGPRYVPGRPSGPAGDGITTVGWAPPTDQVPDAPAITPPVVAAADRDLNPVAIEVRLDAGFALAEVDSPDHPVQISRLDKGRYRVRLADGEAPADRDFVLRWRPRLGSEPAAALFRETWHGAAYGLLMLMPPQADGVAPVPRELILVVDTSGSMHGDSIAQARAAVLDALDQLQPRDRFNIIQFNSATHALFASARTADATNLRAARRYVRALQADGGTEMLPAMHRALRRPAATGYLRQVVFLTDGAVGNEAALFAAVARHIGDSRLFTVGIGSAPNALFMTRAAAFGRGTFTYIGSTAEVQREVAALFRRLRAPVLTDVRLRWEGAGADMVVTQVPAAIPDLYAGQPLAVAIQATRMPRRVWVEGRLGERVWRHALSLTGGAVASGVHGLWARRMIGDWHGRGVTGTAPETVRRAVLALALRHRLVSRYTSLVAIDRTPGRPRDAALQSSPMPTRLPAGWSATAVFGRLPGTATPWLLHLLAGLVAVGIGWRIRA